MSGNYVSTELADAILQIQDRLPGILEDMVLLGEPSKDYERLMTILAYLHDFSEDLSVKAAQYKETLKENVLFGDFSDN